MGSWSGINTGSRTEIKLYLAGPEIFLPNAAEHAQTQKEFCKKYGFIGLHPMDNNVDRENRSYDTAVRIYRSDVRQVRECDIVVANCNSFRGALMDDGTAYEFGFGNALGKPSYGYLTSRYTYNQRMIDRGQAYFSKLRNALVDCQNYLLGDDFGTFINLMMQCGMTEHGGRLIHGSFEDCLKAIREDLDNGMLILPTTQSSPISQHLSFMGDAIWKFWKLTGKFPTAPNIAMVKELASSGICNMGDSGLAVIDIWGNPYIYRNPGILFPRFFDLYSMGADGVDNNGNGDDVVYIPRQK